MPTKIKQIPRNLEKMIPLSQTLIKVCSDIGMISCSWLFPICNFFLGIVFGDLLTPRCCKANYIIACALPNKSINNTGYTSHYSAAQNKGKWLSEKGNFYIVSALTFLSIAQADPAFCKGEIFRSVWKLLQASSVHNLEEQQKPSWKVMLASEGQYKCKHI